jgi:hypothetical protein
MCGIVQGKIGSNLAYCKSYLSVTWETKENPYKAARLNLQTPRRNHCVLCMSLYCTRNRNYKTSDAVAQPNLSDCRFQHSTNYNEQYYDTYAHLNCDSFSLHNLVFVF